MKEDERSLMVYALEEHGSDLFGTIGFAILLGNAIFGDLNVINVAYFFAWIFGLSAIVCNVSRTNGNSAHLLFLVIWMFLGLTFL